MDLTVCNLEHPKRIHLLNWNKMGPLEKVHVVSVHEQRCEEAAGEGEMCMKKLAESFHCYVAQLPLTFLLSTVFLDFITDQLPDGTYSMGHILAHSAHSGCILCRGNR